jgi:hypothetical protein
MAVYKYSDFVQHSTGVAFDKIIESSASAPWPGIYRCEGCGHETAVAQGHSLPPQNHHHHSDNQGAIRWRLIVSHKKY